ncbi:MAG TPA: DUF2336 domain-containing protein, partial [Methylocystis sp.]|nr:DUF2336 domain-containing protein [Methylocystis sp.]
MGARVEERQNAIGALLQTIVEQFAERSGHRPEDIRQFERLAGDLIDIAGSDSVVAVAKTLCLHLETPKSLIARLFHRGGACARIAFEFAPMAPAAELLVNAEHEAPELAAAIARRPDLSRETVAALSARSEPKVLRALAANRLLRLDPATLRALMQSARDDLVLARILLDRDDLDLDPEPLFLAATAGERSAILLASCRLAMLAPVGELGAEGRRFLSAGAGLATVLLDLAIRQSHDAMVTVVADALDARKSRVRRIFEDEGGEALSLTLVALGLDVDTATKIFLCGERSYGRNVARLRELRA